MDHAEARDRLEKAAAEPGAIDRLMAGESPDAALAEHLDGCADCRAELDVLRQTAAAVRDAVRETPSADLRERTLAYVARVGRPRGADVSPAASRPGWLPAAWTAAVAAAAVVVGLFVWSGTSSRLAEADAAIADQRATLAGLSIVIDWTLRLSADPETSGVQLAADGAGAATGTVLYSPDRGELVMVASGLPVPPDGQEYRCWIQENGERVPIGAMYRAGALAYWAGDVDALRGRGDGLAFGVSLVDAASEGISGEVVLAGAS
jgi:Anti-sigma-K factor rskA